MRRQYSYIIMYAYRLANIRKKSIKQAPVVQYNVSLVFTQSFGEILFRISFSTLDIQASEITKIFFNLFYYKVDTGLINLLPKTKRQTRAVNNKINETLCWPTRRCRSTCRFRSLSCTRWWHSWASPGRIFFAQVWCFFFTNIRRAYAPQDENILLW